MSSSHQFREILIFVAGATPQIITETIYALAMQDPPIHADELYVITTTTGRTIIRNKLVDEGHLKRLCDEYALPPLALEEDSFVILSDPQARQLEDIRSVSDNEAAGDQISNFIRSKTQEKGTRLHCSLAGGRKTMSFYLGAALQLFGRPQDRLYHILVSPEFEANPAFYYPPAQDTYIECRMHDGSTQRVNARLAQVELAELPFVRLGELKPPEATAGYRDMVLAGQREVDSATHQPVLQVSLVDRTLRIGDTLIELIPVQLMLYLAFLRQKIDHCRYPSKPYCRDCTGCFETIVGFASREALEEMAADYGRIYAGNRSRVDDLLKKWPEGMDIQTLRAIISKVNRAVREQLADEALAPYYIIAVDRKYAGSRYGIRLEKSKIRITGDAP